MLSHDIGFKAAKSIKKFFFIKILVSKLFGYQSEHHTAIWTDNLFRVGIVASDVSQISTASNRFHNWEQKHHGLGTNTLSLFIDGTAISAGMPSPDLLAVGAHK